MANSALNESAKRARAALEEPSSKAQETELSLRHIVLAFPTQDGTRTLQRGNYLSATGGGAVIEQLTLTAFAAVRVVLKNGRQILMMPANLLSVELESEP